MTERSPKALKAALEFEDKGKNFYLKTANAAADPLSQRLFNTLAGDEERHAERIREIYAALDKNQPWPVHTPAAQGRLEREIRGFFDSNRGALNRETQQIEGYEFAIKMELTGIELYTKFARETDDPQEKSFFEALLVEERSHLEALRNVHFFLTQPGDWYEQDESRRWNWMNL